MELKVRLLEIVPETEKLKKLPTDLLSLNFTSQNNLSKIENIEKLIEKKEFLTLSIKNISEKIKLTLLLNNVSIIGTAQFIPCSDIKYYTINDINNSSVNKKKIIKIKLETILNNNKSANKQKRKKIINYITSSKNIKENQSFLIKKKNSSNYPKNTQKSPLFKSPCFSNYKKIQSSKNNESLKNIKSISLALDFDNSNKTISSSALKKYTNNKCCMNLKKEKYKTLNNYNKLNHSCKIKHKNINYNKTEPNNTNISDYYQIEINNKNIEDSIFDPNFKKILLGDEMLSERKNSKQENVIIADETRNQRLSSKLTNNTYTNDNNFSDLSNRVGNSLKNVLNINNKNQQKINSPLNSSEGSDDLAKHLENISKILPRSNNTFLKIINNDNDNENIIKYENVKKDFLLFYSKEYLNSINEEMLDLETQLMIDKILELQSVYMEEYRNFSINIKASKNALKYMQKKYFLLNKEMQKLQNEKMKLFFREKLKDKIYTYENTNKHKETTLLNSIISKINLKKGPNPLRNVFLIICGNNENKLNALSKKYYYEYIKRHMKENNKINIEENKKCIKNNHINNNNVNNNQIYKKQKNNKSTNNGKCRKKIPFCKKNNSVKSDKSFVRNMTSKKINNKLNT